MIRYTTSIGNTPPFFLAINVRSDGLVLSSSLTGPSPLPFWPWHAAQLDERSARGAFPARRVAKIAKPTGSKLVKSPAESGEICSVEVEEK
jgi:hypothetical protein